LIVVDAGVVVTALTVDDHRGAGAQARLAQHPRAPELIGVEVVSAVRRLTAAGSLEPWRATRAVADFVDLPLRLAPHRPLLARCWELRNTVTPYDAVYVALAELMDATLLTTDRRLAQAPGVLCRVEVIE
jgi:predicted nucleic acid-binding protein